ncbi:tetratricopeptide repeat protein [Desulfurobacterium sp.]
MKKLAVVYLSLIVFTGTAFPAENLGNMFKNQDYDEIIGILQNVPEQRLSAEELLYLGFSMLMTGNYKKGERLLRLSFQKKPLPETGKILAEIYFSRRNYQKVIEIYKKLGRHVPDEVKLLTALSYRALNKNETAKSIAEQIKNPELKLKTGLPVKTVKVFSTIQYDSNPLFIPEDEFKETFGGWMINTGFKYSAISRNSS